MFNDLLLHIFDILADFCYFEKLQEMKMKMKADGVRFAFDRDILESLTDNEAKCV
jgi:hypothetical protein